MPANPWPVVRITEVARLNARWDADVDGRPVSFVPMADVEAGTGRIVLSSIRSSESVRKGFTQFQEGDVLFAKITPCMENGKVGLAAGLVNGLGAGSTEFHVLRPQAPLDPRFLMHYLLQDQVRREARAWMRGAAGQLRVPPEFFGHLCMPLPPVPEQRRIVAEIESQFTRLDAAVAALQRSQKQVAKCRASILAAAVTGRFGRSQRQSKEWPWVPIADLAERSPNAITDGPFGSNLKTSHYVGEGPRVVRLQNIGECRFVDERACISDEHFARLQKHRVIAGDVLIAALGNELPRACLAPDDLGPAIVKADCIRLRPSADRVSARYLCYALNSFPVRSATRKLVHGVGRPRLNLSEIKSVQVPLPSMTEQADIVAAIEDWFSLLDKSESLIQSSIQRAARLRQAILKRAFEGRLVPQDPNDEPAEILLQRIRANHRPALGRKAATEGK